MAEVNFLIWLFPLLFIIHDFEEIIFVKPWINKNRDFFLRKYPKISKKLIPHFDNITTSSFALGVAEEFILISAVTVTAYITRWYYVWLGGFVVFTLHLVVHCFQVILLKRYVPVLVTSLVCLPFCIYILNILLNSGSFRMHTVIAASVICAVVILINGVAIHMGMEVFDKWLINYQKKPG